MFNDTVVIETERLVLRPFEKKDVARVFELLHGNEALVQYLPFDAPKAIGDTEAFYAFVCENDAEQVMAITNNGIIIGLTAISNIIATHKGSIGYWVHQNYQGQGFVTESTQAMADWALEETGLQLLLGNTFGPNSGSQRVLEKCGFTFVGKIPLGERKNGKYFDQTVWYKTKK
jgi:ribosomal-protein-alanine N-acetyltransferase